VGTENNTTIVFPVPIDLFSPFLRGAGRNGQVDPDQPVGAFAGGR
jgi:hypothetical protein